MNAEVEIRHRVALVVLLTGEHIVFDEPAVTAASVFLERSEAAIAGPVVAMSDRRSTGAAAVLFSLQNAATGRCAARGK